MDNQTNIAETVVGEPDAAGVCPACGTAFSAQAHFCNGCGIAVRALVPAPRKVRSRAWLGVLAMMVIGFACIAIYAHFFTGESGVQGNRWFDMPIYPGVQVEPAPFQGPAYAVATFSTETPAVQVTAWYRDAVIAAGMVRVQGVYAPSMFGQTVELYAYGDYIYGFTVATKGTYTTVGLTRVDPSVGR
jgi:hypothetical protein